ncbi:hypothetical protein [Belnapia rosea]|nr:hypothetical protein [Belnapia rosea]
MALPSPPVSGGDGMGWFVGEGHVVPLLLGFVLAEAAVLLLLRRRSGRGLPPLDIALLLAPGACLMLALWAALARAWWGWIALALAASLVTHLFDLRRRWRGSGR